MIFVNTLRTFFLSLTLCTGIAAADGTDWPYYGSDAASTKFAPITQIDRGNLEDLRMVWRWRMPDHEIMDANDGISSQSPNEVTPIVVDGVLYSSTPLNIVVALDAETGEELWRFDPEAWREDSVLFGLHLNWSLNNSGGRSDQDLQSSRQWWGKLRATIPRYERIS